jgi:hypothetical protein
MISDQIGGDLKNIALRAVQPGPSGQQPDEGLGRYLVGCVVVLDEASDPTGELGVNALNSSPTASA